MPTQEEKAMQQQVLVLKQQVAILEAKLGMKKVERPRGFAKLEKVDKRPARKDGPLYECMHTIFDATNNITIPAETVIQTHCENWVKRMGAMVSEPAHSLPPGYDPGEVRILTNTIEDGAPPVEEDTPKPKARGQFKRRASKKEKQEEAPALEE